MVIYTLVSHTQATRIYIIVPIHINTNASKSKQIRGKKTSKINILRYKPIGSETQTKLAIINESKEKSKSLK